VKDLLSNVGAGGGAPAVGAPAAAGGGAAAPAAEEKKEEKVEEKEESDDDMVCSIQWHAAKRLLTLATFLGLRSLRLIAFHLFRCISSFIPHYIHLLCGPPLPTVHTQSHKTETCAATIQDTHLACHWVRTSFMSHSKSRILLLSHSQCTRSP
jgi:hypothetical protein